MRPCAHAPVRPSALSKAAELVTGTSPRAPVGPDVVSFIQIKDLDTSRRALVCGSRPTVKRALAVRPGDVLLAARGDRALAVLADVGLEGAYPTLDVYLIRPDARRLDPAYLAAFLSLEQVRAQLKASTTGVLIPRIPKATLAGLPIPLPSLEHQRRIGALAQAMRTERALIAQLASAHIFLRERQLAAAFANLK